MEDGGILLIDKQQDWTSNDVVAKTRGILRTKRIGHAGTLDPMATGLLVLFVGKSTKSIQYFNGDKTYIAELELGKISNTQDIWGEVTNTCMTIPSTEQLLKILPKFTGAIMQTPPMFSAVKINGERLYKAARRGEIIERPARERTIYSLEYLGGCEKGKHQLKISCSSGTYIRTLIHDIGKELGCGAVMTSLRRISSGGFSVEDACFVNDVSPEKLITQYENLISR